MRMASSARSTRPPSMGKAGMRLNSTSEMFTVITRSRKLPEAMVHSLSGTRFEVKKRYANNPAASNLFAAVSGAFMYFATLTEVPIVQGLVGSGMGAGPSLALLLAGPALSLPAMLVLNSIVGLKKTVTYIVLVVVMATITGWGYGALLT